MRGLVDGVEPKSSNFHQKGSSGESYHELGKGEKEGCFKMILEVVSVGRLRAPPKIRGVCTVKK